MLEQETARVDQYDIDMAIVQPKTLGTLLDEDNYLHTDKGDQSGCDNLLTEQLPGIRFLTRSVTVRDHEGAGEEVHEVPGQAGDAVVAGAGQVHEECVLFPNDKDFHITDYLAKDYVCRFETGASDGCPDAEQLHGQGQGLAEQDGGVCADHIDQPAEPQGDEAGQGWYTGLEGGAGDIDHQQVGSGKGHGTQGLDQDEMDQDNDNFQCNNIELSQDTKFGPGLLYVQDTNIDEKAGPAGGQQEQWLHGGDGQGPGGGSQDDDGRVHQDNHQIMTKNTPGKSKPYFEIDLFVASSSTKTK